MTNLYCAFTNSAPDVQRTHRGEEEIAWTHCYSLSLFQMPCVAAVFRLRRGMLWGMCDCLGGSVKFNRWLSDSPPTILFDRLRAAAPLWGMVVTLGGLLPPMLFLGCTTRVFESIASGCREKSLIMSSPPSRATTGGKVILRLRYIIHDSCAYK